MGAFDHRLMGIEYPIVDGWAVEEIRAARFEVAPDLKDISLSEGGPKAWFSVIRRKG
jgi:hypothetical protein